MTEYPFTTLQQQQIASARHYCERARRYIKEGNLEYALGCLIKANKKMKQAQGFKLGDHPAFKNGLIALTDAIEVAITEGI